MAKKTTKKQTKSKIRDTKLEAGNTFGEVLGVILIALGILMAAFLYFGYDAPIAKVSRLLAFGLTGALGYVFPLILIGIGVLFIVNVDMQKKNVLLVLAFIVLLGAFLEIVSKRVYKATDLSFFSYIGNAFARHEQRTGGGFFGAFLSYPLEILFGKIGTIIILIALMLVVILLITHLSIRDVATNVHGRMIDAQTRAALARAEREQRRQNVLEQDPEDIYRKTFEENDRQPEPEPEKRHPLNLDQTIVSDAEEKEEQAPVFKTGDIYAEPFYEDRKDDVKLSIYGREDKDKKFETQDNSGSYLDLHKMGTGVRKEEKKDEEPRKSQFNNEIIGAQPFTESREEKEKDNEKDNSSAYFTPPPIPDGDIKKKEPRKDADPAPEEYDQGDIFEAVDEQPVPKKYELPERLDLLDRPVGAQSSTAQLRANNSNKELLEKTLKNFGIDVTVNNIVTGPTVTRYEMTPAPGVKVSRILNLSNDIALSLAAPSVRIEAPIPGKAAIGIEIPNSERRMVKIRELIDTDEFRNAKSSIFFALGKDINGKNVYGDLAKMPHLLVAGTTGSGKSVCINSIIMSILYRSSPEEVNFLMVDPKVVEMKRFNGIPHMKTQVVTDPKKATSMLNWVVNEMLKRYKDFADTNVKHLDSYNELMKANGRKILPKIVVIIDELADLMMASKHEVEDAICRIAQLGRAAGIHLVVATQTPRADVITGMIKTNISSRIALSVASGLDSRIILDRNGAEDLLGNGDMLFMPLGQSNPVRLQGCFISDAENDRVIEFLKKQGIDQERDEELEQQLEKGVDAAGSVTEATSEKNVAGFEDELTADAVELALEYNGISTSMLQRRLKIGYARAARIIDELEMKDIVSGADGSKPREVLISKKDYYRMIGREDDSAEE